MKHAILILAISTCTCLAQFGETSTTTYSRNRDGTYTGYTTYDTMAERSTYTPRSERNARAAMQEFMPQRAYDYDELNNKYPVREVVPRNQLPYGAQMQLEQQDIQLRNQRLAEQRQELDIKKDQKALQLQESIVRDAAGALDAIGELNPDSADFPEQVATLYKQFPNAAEDTGVKNAIAVLHNRHERLQSASEIRDRSRVARDEAQDYQARERAAQIASELGDEETYNNVISAASGGEALDFARQQQTKIKRATLERALYDEYKDIHGREPDDNFWSKFYTNGAFNPIAAERALKEFGTQERDTAKREGELWSRMTTIENTIGRLRSQLNDRYTDEKDKPGIIERIKGYEAAHRGVAKKLGLEDEFSNVQSGTADDYLQDLPKATNSGK